MNDELEFNTPETTSTPDTDAYDEALDPAIITSVGVDLLDSDYDTAKTKLKDLYENNEWTDKEKAAQYLSETFNNLNRVHDVKPEVKLESDISELSKVILDPKLTEDIKLDSIENWRENTKASLYNTDSADSLVSSFMTERQIDAYADDFRRGIVANDRGRILDMFTRGVEAAVSPLAGLSDAVFGSDLEKPLRKLAQDYENPNYDESLLSIAASGVGSVTGFAVASLNPWTGWGYLGAVLTDQGKSVYDQAYEATGSREAAKNALASATPGILLGATADRLVGGSLGAILKGQKGYLSALTGLTAGATGFTAQSYGMGSALAEATGEEAYRPSLEKLGKEALVGGAIGGLIGGARDISIKAANMREAQLNKAREQVQRTLGVENPPEVEDQPNLVAQQFVKKPVEEKPTSETPVEEIPTETDQVAGEADIRVNAEVSVSPQAKEERSPDQFTNVFPIVPSEGATPNPVILEFVRELGVKPELINSTKRWGFIAVPDEAYQLAGKAVRLGINREAFKSQEQAEKTISHEFTHLADAYGRTQEAQTALTLPPNEKESVAIKLLRFNRSQLPLYNDVNFKLEAERLSRAWRPGWEVRPDYRKNTNEVMADVGSAMFQNPEWVHNTHPRIYESFMKGLENFPKVKDFWDRAQEMRNDPSKHAAWVEQQREKGRIKEAEITAKAMQKKLEADAEKKSKQRGEAITDTLHRTVNAFHVARKVVDKLIKMGYSKEEVIGLYNKLYSWKNAYQTVDALLDAPLRKIYNDYLKLGIPGSERDPLATWKNYETYNRNINDSTELMENVKDHPARFRAAGEDILAYLPGLQKDLTNLSGRELVEALADIHKSIANPNQRARLQKILVDANKMDAAAVLEEHAFNVRSLIANPDVSYRDAQKLLAMMKAKLGPEKFKELEEFSKKYHAIFLPVTKALDDAGLLTRKMSKRLDINKDNYITTNVIKYYEQNPHLSATLKAQTGTIDQVGDELAATEMKMKQHMIHAELQQAMNAAVQLARASGTGIRTVEPEMGYAVKQGKSVPVQKNVYDQKAKLQKEHPDKSYLLEYEEGRPTLYEIDSPDYAKMFEGRKLDKVPVVGYGLRLINDVYNYTLAREFKVLFSLPFLISSRFRDVAQEAVAARSLEPFGLWFHMDKSLRAVRQEGKRIAIDYHKGGLVDPELKAVIERNGIPYLGAEAMIGRDPTGAAYVDGVYRVAGVDVPHEDSMNRSLRVSKKLNSLMEKVPFMKAIKRKTVIDELTTKMTGYLIGTRLKGMGPEEASLWAREYFGTPDPTGGGSEAANINIGFMFGRAHVNGMRATVNQFKNSPLGYGSQYVYRKLIPRLLTSGGIMAPLVYALFGEDAEKVYRKFSDKISYYDKMSKFNLPLGFLDETGEYRGFNVNSDDITHEWKAVTLRSPMNLDLITMDQLISPVTKSLEEFADTGTISLKHIGQNTVAALKAAAGGAVAPPIQWATNIGSLLGGYNPQDYYRNKDILPRDVQEAGTFFEKFYQYMTWALYNNYPAMFNYKYKAESTEPTSPFEYLAMFPQVGQAAQRFVSATNYGDYEKFKELEQQKTERDAEIRLNLGTNSRILYNEYRKTQALISKLGKEWRQEESPDYANRVHLLNSWHSHLYEPAFNELRASHEDGDAEDAKARSDQLEDMSQYYIDALK